VLVVDDDVDVEVDVVDVVVEESVVVANKLYKSSISEAERARS